MWIEGECWKGHIVEIEANLDSSHARAGRDLTCEVGPPARARNRRKFPGILDVAKSARSSGAGGSRRGHSQNGWICMNDWKSMHARARAAQGFDVSGFFRCHHEPRQADIDDDVHNCV